MLTKDEIVKDYNKFKSNPDLYIFEFTQDLKEKVIEMVEVEVGKAVSKLQQQTPVNAGFIEKITARIVANLIKDTKGDKGDKGDSIIGARGLMGPKPILGRDYPIPKDGHTPIKGKDYFTPAEVRQLLKEITPKKGLHYFTKAEIERIIKAATPKKGIDYFDGKDAKNLTSMSGIEIRKKLESLKENERLDVSAIKHIDEVIDRLIRMIPRRKTDMRVGELVGTGDGTTTTFTLPFVPAKPDRIMLTVGGGLMFLTEDFTLAEGKIATFIIAPPDGAKIRILAEA